MKKIGALILCIALALASLSVVNPTQTVADTTTRVSGTVLKGTSASYLKLSTPEGLMEIKINSDADLSECKNLLPGKSVKADVVYGGDGYMHAVKIIDGNSSSVAKGITVSGKILDAETGGTDVFYLKTKDSNLAIKINTNTDLSGCKMLVAGNYYTVTYTGTGLYKDAVSIKDGESTQNSQTSTTTAKSGEGTTTELTANTVSTNYEITNVNNATASVSGSVTADTTKSILYLNTSGGVMQFKIDEDTVTTDALVEMPGMAYKVFYSYGSDSYLHARVIKGGRVPVESGAALNGATATVTGTVMRSSSEGLIKLNTDSGIMLLKMDKLQEVSNGNRIIGDQKITADIAYGTDAYWHATKIIVQ